MHHYVKHFPECLLRTNIMLLKNSLHVYLQRHTLTKHLLPRDLYESGWYTSVRSLRTVVSLALFYEAETFRFMRMKY